MSYRSIVRRAPWVAAGALLLASCATQPTVHHSRIYHDYYQDFFSGAPGTKFLAVVWGNPFAADKAETDAVVVDTAERAFGRRGYGFSTQPERVNPLVPYLAVVFNAGHAESGLPCTDLSRLSPPPPPNGNVSVQAALCRGNKQLTAAKGSVAGVRGPDDPRFRALTYQVAAQLFRTPPRSGSPNVVEASAF